MTKERWKPVVGYEADYEVSSVGSVRRVSSARGARVGRILRPILIRATGYLRVSLSNSNRKRLVCVHRLVAEAFLGPCPVGHEVNHRDGVKTHNVDTNLEYLTRQQNMIHAVSCGLVRSGRNSPLAKTTDAQKAEIQARYRSGGVSMRVLGLDFGVSIGTIHRLVHG